VHVSSHASVPEVLVGNDLTGSPQVEKARVKLQIRGVFVRYINYQRRQHTDALAGIDLDVDDQEFVSIVGPSGCGKTTLLNAIDGLIPIHQGSIAIDGSEVKGPGRDRAMVFQQPALMPWRSVVDNVVYGLELRGGLSKQRMREGAQRYIDLVDLRGFEHHYPGELSGGMQQRVNLARALVCEPKLLLLDEPFGALDAQTREFMQAELLRIWRTTHQTSLFITHQIDEAIYLSDRVVVFTARPGRIREIVEVDLPRPRPLSIKRSPRFLEIYDYCWRLIEEEARASGIG
jgi:NitT/TauT family transport system ATP-binding protein